MRIFLAFLLCAFTVVGDIFYVATDGDDATGTGSLASPWATIERAREYVATNTPSDGHTINIRGGYYYITNAITFSASDSGGASTPVMYRNYSGEIPVLVNGRAITNMVDIGGGLYSTDVSTQGFSGINFRALYLDYERQVNARYPNVGSYLYTASTGNVTTLYADVGAIPAWADITQGRVTWFSDAWWAWTANITGYDGGTRALSHDSVSNGNNLANKAYWINGIPEALDATNEWVLTNNVLVIKPASTLTGKHLYAPTGGSLFVMDGCSNVWLRGLTMTASAEHSVLMTNSASWNKVLGCKLKGTCSPVGGLQTKASVRITGGTSNVVQSCYFAGTAALAIAVNGGDCPSRVLAGHTIANNWIDGCDGEWVFAGVISLSGAGFTVTRNTVNDVPANGIRMGDGVCDILIEQNIVDNSGNGSEDVGGIYITGGTSDAKFYSGANVRIVGNIVKNVRSWSPNRTGSLPSGGKGIYLDGHATGISVVSNVVDNVRNSALFVQYGNYNIFANNLLMNTNDVFIAEASAGEAMYVTGNPDALPSAYLTTWQSMTNTAAWNGFRGESVYPGTWASTQDHGRHITTNNVMWVVGTSGYQQVATVSLYNVENTNANNTYWHSTRDQTNTSQFYHYIVPGPPWGTTYNFSGWTNLWSATGEIWANPQVTYGSYTLAAGSPALANGFGQIDWENAGVYDDEYWTEGNPDPPEWPETIGDKATVRGKAIIRGRIR